MNEKKMNEAFFTDASLFFLKLNCSYFLFINLLDKLVKQERQTGSG